MTFLTRSISLAALALSLGTAGLAAQQVYDRGEESFRWHLGAQGGVLSFRSPGQTRGAIPLAGIHFLVNARRGGLMISVEEGFGDGERTFYADPAAPGGSRPIEFNDIRKYSATLTAHPFRGALRPYLGVGFGILHVVNPSLPQGTAPATPAEQQAVLNTASDRASTGFGSLLGGVELHGRRFSLFGQYQVTTSPPREKLLAGPTHTIVGGLRINLGSAREGITGGGY
jgi:hypothetical protein